MDPRLKSLYQRIIDGAIDSARELILALAQHDSESRGFYEYLSAEEQEEVWLIFTESLATCSFAELSDLITELLNAKVDPDSNFALFFSVPSPFVQDHFRLIYDTITDKVNYTYKKAFLALPLSSATESVALNINFEISQDELIPQLIRYLELNGGNSSIIDTEGVCHGLAICMAAMCLVDKQDWWYQLLTLIEIWDPATDDIKTKVSLRDGSELTYEEIFERVIHYVVFHQGRIEESARETAISSAAASHSSALSTAEASAAFTNILPIQDQVLDHFEVDIKNASGHFETKKIKQIKYLPGFFSLDELVDILADPLFLTPGLIINIHSLTHTTALVYDQKTELFCFYDPNDGSRYFTMDQLSLLAKNILFSIEQSFCFSIASLDEEDSFQYKAYENWLITKVKTPAVHDELAKFISKNLIVDDKGSELLELIFSADTDKVLLNFCIATKLVRESLCSLGTATILDKLLHYINTGGNIVQVLKLIFSTSSVDGLNLLRCLSDQAFTELQRVIDERIVTLLENDRDRVELIENVAAAQLNGVSLLKIFSAEENIVFDEEIVSENRAQQLLLHFPSELIADILIRYLQLSDDVSTVKSIIQMTNLVSRISVDKLDELIAGLSAYSKISSKADLLEFLNPTVEMTMLKPLRVSAAVGLFATSKFDDVSLADELTLEIPFPVDRAELKCR